MNYIDTSLPYLALMWVFAAKVLRTI